MGRKESSTTTTTTAAAAAAATRSMRLPPQHQALEVKIPSFFRCPISLDVMRSPVSLCTGVTYDRASIQRWLDSGNTTCPATMLPLPSTDLVPNLTLRSLISHWSSSSPATSGDASVTSSPAGLVRQVASPDADPSAALRQLAAYLSDDDVDEFEKNALVGAGGAAEAVASVLRRKGEREVGVEGCEAAVRVLAAVVAMDGVEDANKRRVAAGLAADAAASAASLARVMRGASGLEARVDAARLVEFLLANAADEAREAVAESAELVAELVRLVGPADEKGSLDARAVGAGLSCLATISRSRRAARAEMVRAGTVRAAARALRATAADPAASARALRVLESAVGCAEGRAALCEDAEQAVPAVVGRMMKAGRDGAEAAEAVLWAVCHKYRDRRAADAAAASEGGLTRLLLLLQSGCSPAARQMALELLKIYKVNAKSCLAGYDSKTTHIMPF
ncbi:Os04g0418500 [Oryza sativa Japonica Group]|uniref:U-box domain-containing protein n=1 Tax=Oryza sativa subsp. japonica TaxID=39947 RepID=A0A0P0WAA1_ORYSJ|nr:U-box domain-containing protein 29 [Oryza sativa Japonica Group]USI00134.1 putative U-box protein CMPG1 [Oryza sativa Japonica Group]BAS89171.1 Os04g0418500 [Oryza sativa Japonica Group]